MDKSMKEGSKALVDNAECLDNSLKELRNLSSQLYHAADYCEKSFFNSQDKKIVMDTTKEYICRAVVTMVDHVGSISANLESCISNTNSVSETEHKIRTLKQRIMTCQQYSHKLTVSRFYRGSEFSRFHCRYIALHKPSTDSAVKNVVSRNSGKENPFEIEEPLFLYTYNCKPHFVNKGFLSTTENTSEDCENLVPVRDGVLISPKSTEHSRFKFQEDQKLKRSLLNWKVMMQNKDINSLIKRGKRILS